MEYSSKKANGWVEATTKTHQDRLAGFTFNPTPLDLQSNRDIRIVGQVVDALYSAEFEKVVRPLSALHLVVSGLTSNVVAVLARTIRDCHSLDVSTILSHVSVMQSELDGSIDSSPLVDKSRREKLYGVVDNVTRDIKDFLRRTIDEATARREDEKQVGFSRLPGAPNAKELHKLYYPAVEKTSSPWERFASESDRRPVNSESADIVGAPREDVPLVEHVYTHDDGSLDDDETLY